MTATGKVQADPAKPRQPGRAALQRTLRRLHRWTALPLFAFLALIAASGTALQLIMMIYGDTGPRRAPGEPLWVVTVRDLAVTLHTGAFAGIAGVYVSVLCALGLLLFSVTGIWMYLDLYRVRAAQNRRALFWRTRAGKGPMLRSLHRWCTPLIGPLAIFLAVTGVSLAVYFAWFNIVPLPPRRGGAGALPPPTPGPPPSEGRVWHDFSLTIHKLNFLGEAGHLIGVLAGAAMLFLSVSGVWMYLQLYSQRRKTGSGKLFW